MSLLSKSMAACQAHTPKKRSRNGRHYQVVDESSDKESLSSEEEEEPTLPPKQKKSKKKKKQTQQKATARGSTFKIDGLYKPGMKWDPNWSKGMKAAYQSARNNFIKTGSREAIKDKLDSITMMLKKAEANNALQEKMDNLTTALEKWETKLAE